MQKERRRSLSTKSDSKDLPPVARSGYMYHSCRGASIANTTREGDIHGFNRRNYPNTRRRDSFINYGMQEIHLRRKVGDNKLLESGRAFRSSTTLPNSSTTEAE